MLSGDLTKSDSESMLIRRWRWFEEEVIAEDRILGWQDELIKNEGNRMIVHVDEMLRSSNRNKAEEVWKSAIKLKSFIHS